MKILEVLYFLGILDSLGILVLPMTLEVLLLLLLVNL
jgi:hypothetical protein